MHSNGFLRGSLSALAMAVAVFAALPAMADEHRITVTGEASIERAPDMASFSIGVTTVGANASEALKANSTEIAAVIARLKEAGVSAGDLQTVGLSINPNWDSSKSSAPNQITSFTASNTLMVTIRKLDTLGDLLDKTISDGANTLYGVQFGLADNRPVMDEARKAAVKDARAKAELLAEAAGLKLGKIVGISEGSGYGGPAPMFRAEAAAAAPIEQGQVSTTASVTITYEIED